MSGARLAGKVAIVSGAARGIGEAIARKFVEHGAKVALCDINVDLGAQVAGSLGEAALFVPLDVCRIEQWETAVALTQEKFGALDILVNNAGGSAAAPPFEDETLEDHRRIVDLNLTGVWAGMRSVVRAMSSRGGSIINISSIDGLVGVSRMTTYAATKFAVTGMTRSLALELGDRNIRVNSIHPGIIETPLVKMASGAGMKRLENAIAHQPIQRMGRPEEIAFAALYFASDESSYCTGSALVVDGGHIAGPYRDPILP